MASIANRKIVSIAMLLTLTLIFSSSFLFASLSAAEIGGIPAGASRVIIASMFLWIVVTVSGVGLVKGPVLWRYAALYGVVCMSIPNILLPWTLTYISNTTAAIYFSAIPLEVLVLARIFIKTPISFRKWIGFVAATTGLVLLALAGSKGDAGASASSLLHQGSRLDDSLLWIPHLLCIFAALCLATGGVLFQIMPPTSPISMTASALLLGNFMALPVFAFNLPTALPSLIGWVWILGSGVISMGCGMMLRGALIRREGAIFTSTNGYIVPIFTSAVAVLALGETVSTMAVLSYVLVLSGLLISRAKRGEPAPV
ncbi:DMT family transporter [Alphaproteobacteria bacterium]|jgi:drug/metabolite transporter (DMT)-like permease|nr:DMT family transporter [Alphaproteobacteria bacterium]